MPPERHRSGGVHRRLVHWRGRAAMTVRSVHLVPGEAEVGRTRRWRATRMVPVLLATAVLAGCTNTPPPPLVTVPPGSSSSTSTANPGEIVVGVDSVAGGYNPHNLADQSAVTSALATLVLPSVFRPAPDGTPQLDRTLMVSAAVTRAEPYTVLYQIRPEASWSDNAPIAAEDFVYLWQQMRAARDAVHAAGYRLIADITSRDGGKIVEVTFARSYPGWRTLFSGLLPAHLLKDAPGGWANALRDSFPASGGPFSVKTLDRDRGEIALERNDRYWERPSTPDRIILRRADQVGVVEALRNGHDQLALTRVDRIGADLLAGLPAAVHLVSRPSVVSVVVRPTGPHLSQLAVRQAVLALVDRQALIAVGTGNGPPAQLVASAQVLAPSAAGYAPTIPATALTDRARAHRLLADAGYAGPSGGWSRDGQPLRLVIAAPAEREPYIRVAEELRRQLVAEGVNAVVITPTADELFPALAGRSEEAADDGPAAGAHLVVAPRPTGGDPATVLATNFGCLVNQDGAMTSTPASPIGLCDSAIQPTIDAALTGAVALSDALSSVEPALWAQAVSIPLFQEADSLVIRPEVSGVSPGPPDVGPFAGAADWRRSAG